MTPPVDISAAVIKRLPAYYRHLSELLEQGESRISSQQLSERMGLTASQIRQDINCVGGVGQQGFGYHIRELRARIGTILGQDAEYGMIIIGAGNIGRAIANYPAFRSGGYHLEAVFDNSPQLVDTLVGGVRVFPLSALSEWLRVHSVDIAVLSVPPKEAQAVFDLLVTGDVRGVWNFAPVDLVPPPHIAVENVHLSDSLQILSYHIRAKR